MATIGKKYKKARELVDSMKKYELAEAIDLVKKVSYSKFVGSVEIHIKTNAEPRYNDQNMRGTIVLPHGTGKTVKVGAYVSEDKIEEAKKAGADVAGSGDLLKKIEDGNIEFDVLITTQDMMRDLAKVAKVLGPKGLMPSPKAGTVAIDIKETIQEIKKGRVEYKLDKTGNIHLLVGKLNFEDAKLIENIQVLMKVLEDNKPAGVKGRLFKKIVLAPTMGPGVQIVF